VPFLQLVWPGRYYNQNRCFTVETVRHTEMQSGLFISQAVDDLRGDQLLLLHCQKALAIFVLLTTGDGQSRRSYDPLLIGADKSTTVHHPRLH
jgi:hypothetical protein